MMVLTRVMLISISVLLAAPASAGTPIQLWHCEMEDEATEEAVIEGVEEWLASARQVDGGAGLEARVLFPVAVNALGDFDVWIIVTTTSFEAWGRFWDNYPNSDAGDVEDENQELFVCPDSALWDSVEAK